MSESMYRGQLERALRDKAKLEQKQADELNRALRAEDEAARIERSITRTTSASSLSGKQRQINSKLSKAADHRKKAGRIGEDISRKEGVITTARRNLDRVVAQRLRKEESDEKKRRSEEKRHLADMQRERRRADQEEARRRRLAIAHEREVTREVGRRSPLYATSVVAAALQQLPEEITILFASADPRDQARLALGEEVRDIQQRIRAAKHRDAVRLEQIWALRPRDLIPALNQHEPRAVHFSGHGSASDQLIFQDEQGYAKPVPADAIAATLATVADHLSLVVLNACYTADQALAVVEHVPATIGMKDSIGDEAARVFSTAFYGAIADGFSVERAFRQGLAQLLLEGIPEEDTPELFTADGVDADELVLVRPPEPRLDNLAA